MSPKRKIEEPAERVSKKARTSDVGTPVVASFRPARTIASISGWRAETHATRAPLVNELAVYAKPCLHDFTASSPVKTTTSDVSMVESPNPHNRAPDNDVSAAEDSGTKDSGNEKSDDDELDDETPDNEGSDNEDPDNEDPDNEDPDSEDEYSVNEDDDTGHPDYDNESCGNEDSLKEDSEPSISNPPSPKTPSLAPEPNKFMGLSRGDLEQMSKAALIDYILDVQGNYVELPPLHIPTDIRSSGGSNWDEKVTVAMDSAYTMDVDEILLDSLTIR
ncbi:hypothetical protein BJ875DRAFT_444407 [Amylocarpus encephaloides]|uniref:Uncharacterized protein n=1 Tax=Amylocarpus encephaloides TaxID=45428 RepID=A0A9P7YDL8_9HELO|nr:hypothetical protein BJ875DRAFT_444407 [Amylocarpus encephaloides]